MSNFFKDSEDHEEPSCEDLLIDLEAEMGKICPWTCPNRVRQLLAKIAFKVHKDKDPGARKQTLYSLLKKWHFDAFFSGQGNFTHRHLRERRPVEILAEIDWGENISLQQMRLLFFRDTIFKAFASSILCFWPFLTLLAFTLISHCTDF